MNEDTPAGAPSSENRTHEPGSQISATPAPRFRSRPPRLPRLLSWHSSTRKTWKARKRLAESDLTTEYLEAGLRLIAAQFGEARHDPGDGIHEPSTPSVFFGWLSEQKVIDEVNRSGRLHGSQGTFEDRWKYRDFYIEDLLVYTLWEGHWSDRAYIAEEATGSMAGDADLVDAVHEVAYQEVQSALNSDNSRISLITNAISDRYPEMKYAMRDVHRMMLDTWMEVYEVMLDKHGLRLRPGTTSRTVAEILSALSVGISICINFDRSKNLIDDERRRTLLGEAALTLLAGCIDSGDGKSAEELVRDLTRRTTVG
jgi:hypothetical protein